VSGERRTTSEEARRVGNQIGVDWDRFDPEQFRAGMDVGTSTAATTAKPT
jgi:hypothetical protein